MDSADNIPPLSATPTSPPLHSLKVSIISSVCAGLVARLLCHPIDTFKARLQAPDSTSLYKGLWDVVTKTIRTEGVAGMYRGLPAGAVGSIPAVCIYMWGFEKSNQLMKATFPFFATYPSLADFWAGMAAETLSCVVFVPVDVVKERLQVQVKDRALHPEAVSTTHPEGVYKGSRDAFTTIVRQEGVCGIYKGYGATLFSFGPFSACYFLIYENMKRHLLTRNADLAAASLSPLSVVSSSPPPSLSMSSRLPTSSSISLSPPPPPPPPHLSALQSFLCAAVAGTVASVVTNPLDLVKLRLQVQRQRGANQLYAGLWDGLAKVAREDGLKGLLRGAGARVAFHVPNTAITFAVYERCKGALSDVI